MQGEQLTGTVRGHLRQRRDACLQQGAVGRSAQGRQVPDLCRGVSGAHEKQGIGAGINSTKESCISP